MEVFFSADDRQEYLDRLSQSASKNAVDFLAWCRMSHHAHFVVLPHRRDRSRPRSEKRTADTRGWSISVKAFRRQIRFSINPPYWTKVQYTGVIVIH